MSSIYIYIYIFRGSQYNGPSMSYSLILIPIYMLYLIHNLIDCLILQLFYADSSSGLFFNLIEELRQKIL